VALRLVVQSTGFGVRVGDSVKIRVLRVDLTRRLIDFELLEPKPSLASKEPELTENFSDSDGANDMEIVSLQRSNPHVWSPLEEKSKEDGSKPPRKGRKKGRGKKHVGKRGTKGATKGPKGKKGSSRRYS